MAACGTTKEKYLEIVDKGRRRTHSVRLHLHTEWGGERVEGMERRGGGGVGDGGEHFNSSLVSNVDISNKTPDDRIRVLQQIGTGSV